MKKNKRKDCFIPETYFFNENDIFFIKTWKEKVSEKNTID